MPEPVADDDPSWRRRENLLHFAWCSVRYHKKRQRFFDRLDKGTKVVTIGLALTVLAKAQQNYAWLAALITALGLFDLIFGYGDMRNCHRDLGRRSAELVASIESMPGTEVNSVATAEWGAAFARIDADSPPTLKNLMLMCEYEQRVAEGKPTDEDKEGPPVSGFSYLLLDFLDVGRPPKKPKSQQKTP